jgi:mRNA interferase MazF
VTAFLRGEVWAATMPGRDEKYYLVVSNNNRNRALGTALVARITTTIKPQMSSIVQIPDGECVVGRVLCDDIDQLFPEDVRVKRGAFTPGTMKLVGDGLAAALGIR